MANWTFEIRFTTGSTAWDDISDIVLYDSILKDEQLIGSDYRSADDVMRFSVKHESTTTDKVFGADQKIEFKCYATTTDYKFTGIINPSFGQSINQFNGNIDFEATDNGYKLDEPINESIMMPSSVGGTPFHIFATSSTATSIVHTLLAKAGYSSTNISTAGSITDTIEHVSEKQGEVTYRDIIDQIFYEHGYAYRFDENGVFQTVSLRPGSTSTTYTFSSSNITINPPLTRNKILMDDEAVRIKWSRLKKMSNVVLYTDEAETDNDGHWTGTLLSTNGYWPEGGESQAKYQNYDPKRLEVPKPTIRRRRGRPVSLGGQ